MFELTEADVLQDIEEFESRIAAAKKKLAALPKGYLPYQEHKKRELQISLKVSE